MIGRDGRVSVVDLGIVQRVTEKHESTGHAAGTPKYMAPEMFSNQEITNRVDIYSLGIVGYHCLAGVPPFDGPTPMAILYKQAHEDAKPLGKLAPKVSQNMISVIERAMHKDPNERYGLALELASALNGGTNKGGTAIWMVAAFALAGIGAYVFMSQDSAPEAPDERVDASTTLVTQKPLTPQCQPRGQSTRVGQSRIECWSAKGNHVDPRRRYSTNDAPSSRTGKRRISD